MRSTLAFIALTAAAVNAAPAPTSELQQMKRDIINRMSNHK
ncbi:hypothetical protein JCM11641_002557, partial [Rhodosporidiobolus odoratus]